jgi:hypothetical protein
MLAHPKNIESLCCFQGPVAYAHRQRSAALRAKIQAAGSLREIPYPYCGDYGDYLRGFFLILSYPGNLRFHPRNRAVSQRLGSFSKLGFRAVTSHQPRASRTTKKLCFFDTYSVFADSKALFVQGGGYIRLFSWTNEEFPRMA